MFSLTLIKYVQRLQLISQLCYGQRERQRYREEDEKRGDCDRNELRDQTFPSIDKSFPITLSIALRLCPASLIGLNESNEIENKIKLQVFMLSRLSVETSALLRSARVRDEGDRSSFAHLSESTKMSKSMRFTSAQRNNDIHGKTSIPSPNRTLSYSVPAGASESHLFQSLPNGSKAYV